MLSYEVLDFLLLQKNKYVKFLMADEGTGYQAGWVWIEIMPNGDELVVHGTPYTRDEAYEDALRDCLGIIPLADEKIR